MHIGHRFRPPTPPRSILDPQVPLPCIHDWLDSYSQPCFKCGRFCNCDLKTDYPDVLVRSLDGQTIRLNSVLVRGSITLQRKISKKKEKDQLLKLKQQQQLDTEGFIILDEVKNEPEITVMHRNQDVVDCKFKLERKNTIEVIVIDDDDNEPKYKPDIEVIEIDDETDEKQMTAGISGVQECTENEDRGILEKNSSVLDLREEGCKGQIPTIGVTAKTLLLIQEYMSLHLRDIDRAVEKEYHDRQLLFCHGNLYRRPPKKNIINYFKFEDWEEKFFNTDPIILFDIIQAKAELQMWDLHLAAEKWFQLFRGQPKVDNFGKGLYLKRRFKNVYAGSGCEDFVDKKVSNARTKSTHGGPLLYYAKVNGYIFPRKLSFGRSVPIFNRSARQKTS